MHLIQVVPGLPPRTDGIGDYALKLARPLHEEHGIQTHFVVADPDWKGGSVEGFAALHVRARQPEALLEAIASIEAHAGQDRLPVLVHVSPYGYEKRGCPFWLARGLERLHQDRPGRVHAAFHELENHSWRPWSSTFWVPGIQKHLLERVARVATFRYTNTELHRRKLEDWGVGRFHLIPNFSTMGEPRDYPSFEARRKDLIVFGRGAQRQWTYQHGRGVLGRLCALIGAARIVDVGAPIAGMTDTAIGDVPLVRCGRLPEEEVNERMATSLASFTYYPVQFLLKSSVFAVSCAFGTIPFVYDNQPKPKSAPGLVTGEDFVPVGDDLSRLSLLPLEQMSRRVFLGYQSRGTRPAASTVATHLRRATAQ